VNTSSLPNDPAALKGIITSLMAEHEGAIASIVADHEAVVSQMEERIRLLQSIIFGSKSEKRKADTPGQRQLSLFDEIEVSPLIQPELENTETIEVPTHSRKKRGRKPLPEDLPRVEVIHDLPEGEKTCACGCELTRIGEETCEKLDIIPAKVQVIRHIRLKYACRGCEGVESEGGAVKLAPLPPQIIPQSIVTPGLLAFVLVAKFADALPFYRQEAQFKRIGVEVSRASMCNWAMKAAEAVKLLIDYMLAEIRSGPIVNMDETTVQVLGENDRPNTSTSYMWVCRGGIPDRPVVLFRYEPTRSGSVAKEILSDFKGYLQTDGYLGYEALGEQEGIRHVGCLAHVRRKFVEVEKASKNGKNSKGGTAHAVLDLIRKLYAIEKKALVAKLSPEQIKALREEESRPVLSKIKALLDKRVQTTPPKSLLGKAISYALNQWERIERYLEDGQLRPDNNLAENVVRPFAVGRKNWLFSGSPRGADSSAALYSLVETAKANGLEPYAYLRYLFEHLPSAVTEEQRKALLPNRLDPSILQPKSA
jgi:transposase